MSHAASWTIAPGRTTGAASGFPALCVLLCIALSPPALAAQELLGPAVRFSTGAYTRALAVADIDGDGAPDLVTAGGADAAPTVMHNDGDGAFLRTHSYRLGGPIADRVPTEVVESVVPPFLRRVRVDTPDLDGDGVTDLVTFSAFNQHLTTLYGAGDGPRIRREALTGQADSKEA